MDKMGKSIKISEEEKKALINYFSGVLNGNDSDVLNIWLETGEENKLLFDQLADIWQASYFEKVSKQINVEKTWNELQKQLPVKNKSQQIVYNRWLQVAAVFAFAFLLGSGGFYLLNNSRNKTKESLYVEYVSPLGSRSFVQLADGSKVWLNSGSTLKYRNSFGADNRELILTGEAFFEVEKNRNLPFVVKTSEINVIALGTKFNVKAYSEEKTIETTLIEGSVKLESEMVKLTENIILEPNEKAVYTKNNRSLELLATPPDKEEPLAEKKIPKLEIEKEVQPEPIISWKEKRWVINNEKLGNLAVKLERRYDVNFIFDNELLKEYSFGGTLEDETLEQIMEAISFSSPIKYVIEGKTVYIMADGQKIEKFKNLLME